MASGSGTARVLVCVALLLLALHHRARAAEPSSELVRTHFRARGAASVVELTRSFLFEGQSLSRAETLQGDGCVGFFALGLGEVRDVDVGLYTRAGQRVAEDIAAAPYAYARVCGTRGLELYVSATLYAGRGQLVLFRVEGAPRELGRLPKLPLAVAAGGRLEELRSVGAAADELSAETTLLQEERASLAVGYLPAGPPRALEVRAGAARGQLLLRAGRCYRVSAIVPFSRGIALEVEDAGATRWSSQASAEERATLALCALRDGAHEVRVQARTMRGSALVRAFEHTRVQAERVRELGPAIALGIAEAEYVARARGFELSLLGSAWVEGGAPLVWPLSLERAGCYALAAVSEIGAAAVDLRLTDGNGVLIAHNEGRRGVPMLFACVREPATVRLMLKARGPDLRVSVWRGAAGAQP